MQLVERVVKEHLYDKKTSKVSERENLVEKCEKNRWRSSTRTAVSS